MPPPSGPPADPDTQEPTPAPVLVVSGELDNVTTPHEGRVVAGLFGEARFFLARNAGHVDALYHRCGDAARRIRRSLRGALGG